MGTTLPMDILSAFSFKEACVNFIKDLLDIILFVLIVT